MPVTDQWRTKDPGAAVSPRGRDAPPSAVPRAAGKPDSRPKETEAMTAKSGSLPDAATPESPTKGGPLSPGRTKDLAGFWSTQNDEVKGSRKKRLEAVETESAAVVAENVPQRLEGVARSEDPNEWQKSIEVEEGHIKNIATSFQQRRDSDQQNSGNVSGSGDGVVRRTQVKSAADRLSLPAYESRKPATPELVLNRSSATVTLAENQPEELSPDVIRASEGSSWDDVAELEAGRTRNLLQQWKAAEQDAAVPKTSTTRYQGGSKPAWILEIEAAKQTSTGAIGENWSETSASDEPVSRTCSETSAVSETTANVVTNRDVIEEAMETEEMQTKHTEPVLESTPLPLPQPTRLKCEELKIEEPCLVTDEHRQAEIVVEDQPVGSAGSELQAVTAETISKATEDLTFAEVVDQQQRAPAHETQLTANNFDAEMVPTVDRKSAGVEHDVQRSFEASLPVATPATSTTVDRSLFESRESEKQVNTPVAAGVDVEAQPRSNVEWHDAFGPAGNQFEAASKSSPTDKVDVDVTDADNVPAPGVTQTAGSGQPEKSATGAKVQPQRAEVKQAAEIGQDTATTTTTRTTTEKARSALPTAGETTAAEQTRPGKKRHKEEKQKSPENGQTTHRQHPRWGCILM